MQNDRTPAYDAIVRHWLVSKALASEGEELAKHLILFIMSHVQWPESRPLGLEKAGPPFGDSRPNTTVLILHVPIVAYGASESLDLPMYVSGSIAKGNCMVAFGTGPLFPMSDVRSCENAAEEMLKAVHKTITP